MDKKEAFEKLLAKVDPEKRDEAYAKLAAVKTRAEKLDIFESYGVKAGDSLDDIIGETERELTDEELSQVAGGVDWAEILRSGECNCEP